MLRCSSLQRPWTAFFLTVVVLVLFLGLLAMNRVNELAPAPQWRMRELPHERRGRGTSLPVPSSEFMDLEDGGAMPTTTRSPAQAAGASTSSSAATADAAAAGVTLSASTTSSAATADAAAAGVTLSATTASSAAAADDAAAAGVTLSATTASSAATADAAAAGVTLSASTTSSVATTSRAATTSSATTTTSSAATASSVTTPTAAAASCASSPRGRWVPIDGREYARRAEERANLYPDVCWLSVGMHRRFICQPDDLGLQWESDCLEGVDEEAFLERYANKTLSFVGDSMVRQLFFRFACHFARHTVTIDNMNPRKLESPLHRVTLRRNVTLLNQWFGLRPTKHFNNTILQGDVYIFSAGAFAKSWPELEAGLLHWHRVLSGPGHQLVYLEYAAPHFPSYSSDYENLTVALNLSRLHESQKACKPLNYEAFASSRSGFRLHQANELMERLNVSILHAFGITAPMFRQHNMRVWGVQMDCRHYCEPSPAMDAQVRVLHNLLMANGTAP